MDTGLTTAVILATITLGTFLIQRLTDQHGERVALRQYNRRVTGRRGAHSPTRPQPGTTDPPAVRARRDHRDGSRGRLRPRRRTNRTAKGRRT